jgi:xylulose-5-phosphate/fructose-6-phosphate phosphoketolase
MVTTINKPQISTQATSPSPLTPDELRKIHAYWRAANYLSVGQIYLRDNALLREPLILAHTKPRLLGHFGTTPGLNFVYAHMNRITMPFSSPVPGTAVQAWSLIPT